MGVDSGWSLIGRLKRAVKKIRFMLNFDINRWKLASMFGSSSSSNVKRRVSFNDIGRGRAIAGTEDGLRGFMDDSDLITNDSSKVLRRTCSSPYYSYNTEEEDDEPNNIDKRAELFIANFYKQLQIERQISLELRYANNNNFASSPSPSPSR